MACQATVSHRETVLEPSAILAGWFASIHGGIITMTTTNATNLRTIRAAAILRGQHLWVQASHDQWAGPRIIGTFYNPECDEIECQTVNGGRFYVCPSDRITVCDHPHMMGDLA